MTPATYGDKHMSTGDNAFIIRADEATKENDEPARTEQPGKIPNGVFTMIGPRGHKTIKVKTVLHGPLKGSRIVYVMTGSDNIMDYTGVAFLNDDDSVKTWRKQVGSQLETIVTVFRKLFLFADEAASQTQPKSLRELGYTIECAKNCVACNRLLTNPESIELGIGPECRKGGA